MKTKLMIIATILVGIVGGFLLAQNFITGNAQKGNIDADEAKKIALKHFNGEIVEFEYDNDGLNPHYEFEIVGENEKVEMDVNAKNGEVTIRERKSLKQNGTSKKENSSNTTAPIISEDKAVAIALEKTGGGTVTSVELDKDKDTIIYDIEIQNDNVKYDVDINAQTSEVIIREQEIKQKPNTTTSMNEKAANNSNTTDVISKAKAISIALEKTGGGTVTEVELDNENGQYVYEIEIRNGNIEYDLDINAKTGKVIKFKKEIEND